MNQEVDPATAGTFGAANWTHRFKLMRWRWRSPKRLSQTPMSDHDFSRPYREVNSMDEFTAIRREISRKFGTPVKAMTLSNREYKHRFDRLSGTINMKPPPSSFIHIMSGYLVVRKLGQSGQYETWMPDDVFEELYKVRASAQA